MNNICLISSGLQLINAHEFSKHYNIDFIYFAIYDSEKEKEQLLNTAQFLKIIKISFIKRIRTSTYFKLVYLFSFKNIDNFIIGHLEDNHMLFVSKILRYKKIFLVDDGFSTLKDYFNYTSSKNKIRYPKELIFYSIFDFEKDKHHIKNRLNVFKTNNKKISDEVYFIGQPMEEIIGLNYYYSVLKKINVLNPNFTYVAHRRDSKIKLLYIKNNLNIKVLELNEIIELFLIKSKSIPKKIISFYSTSLVVLSIMFKNQIKINYAVRDKLLTKDLMKVFEQYNIKNEL